MNNEERNCKNCGKETISIQLFKHPDFNKQYCSDCFRLLDKLKYRMDLNKLDRSILQNHIKIFV